MSCYFVTSAEWSFNFDIMHVISDLIINIKLLDSDWLKTDVFFLYKHSAKVS